MVLATSMESLIVFIVSVLTSIVDTPIMVPVEVDALSVETVRAFPVAVVNLIVLIEMDDVIRVLAESVLANKVEKDSTFTEVDVAYRFPALIAFPVSVEKNRLVAVRLEVVKVEQNNDVPVSVEHVSLETINEDAIILFAVNVLIVMMVDANELRVREETRVVDTEMVLPIILETDKVLL